MLIERLKANLFKSVDSAFLVVFRIGFAVIMFLEVMRYWSNDWIRLFYIEPGFYFKYYGFEWIHPWPGDGMYYHFIALGILAIFIGLGFLYRISALLFFLAFSYLFLLDQARYLNHFYLVILLSFLLIILPANRNFSIDAKLWPKLKSGTVPAWTIWILRAQFEIVYIYAGLVKINSDWLNLEPLRMWLSTRSDMPFMGELYTQDWAIAIAAYGVILLHVVGAPLLLWKRTRLAVFIIYAAFHTLNHFTFNIGIFPWITLFGTLVFFDPDWPLQLKNKIIQFINPADRKIAEAGIKAVDDHPAITTSSLPQNSLMIFFGVWLAYQILFPLRHLLYPSNVSWSEQGHRFAWQMKLRDKRGFADFTVLDPKSKQNWYVEPEPYLTKKQARKMPTQPDMILQFAHFLEDKWKQDYGLDKVEIRVNNYVSLNGRDPVPLVNPSIDLTTIERSLRPAHWILPLHEPLKRPAKH
ncbi:HTTM domain-containing protein [Kaarinaea lacus]